MDVLSNRQTKQYDYISRYAPFPFYYNGQDGKYVYGITSQLRRDIGFVAHAVKQGDTLDSLSEYYYGRPDLYWVIADFNGIADPFEELWGRRKSVNVPTLSNASFEEQ